MKVNELSTGTKKMSTPQINPKTKKKYSVNFKKRVVQYYLCNLYDLDTIQKKFHISPKLVLRWRKWYFQYFESTYHSQNLDDGKPNAATTYRAIRTTIEIQRRRTQKRTAQEFDLEYHDTLSGKSLRYPNQKKSWHETITEVRKGFPTASLELLCSFFGKTRQAWYKAQNTKESRQVDELLIVEHVKHIRKFLPHLGTRKLHHMMGGFYKKHGIKMGRDKLFEILGKYKLLKNKKKRTATTTYSRHKYRKYPNLIASVSPTRPGQIWVSDITYIRIGNTFNYLSLITDAYSRKIVGWDLSENLQAEGAIRALNMALKQRKDKSFSLTHHSDRGIQYCCGDYITLLQKNGIKVSMTENSEPTENALAERMNRTIKEEFLQYYSFYNHDQAKKATRKAVKYYNGKRPHSSLDYLTPDQAHLKTGTIKKLWKRYFKEFEITSKNNRA